MHPESLWILIKVRFMSWRMDECPLHWCRSKIHFSDDAREKERLKVGAREVRKVQSYFLKMSTFPRDRKWSKKAILCEAKLYSL